jgi:hypothetical protein
MLTCHLAARVAHHEVLDMHMQRQLLTALLAPLLWCGLCGGLCGAHTCSAQTLAKSTHAVALQQVSPAKRTRLDLRPPKITDVFTQETIDRALSATRDLDVIEEVEVEGRRGKDPTRTPNVPGGIAAPFWAVLNPSQSWRILAPLPPDQAAKANSAPPSATDPYRAPVLPPR